VDRARLGGPAAHGRARRRQAAAVQRRSFGPGGRRRPDGRRDADRPAAGRGGRRARVAAEADEAAGEAAPASAAGDVGGERLGGCAEARLDAGGTLIRPASSSSWTQLHRRAREPHRAPRGSAKSRRSRPRAARRDVGSRPPFSVIRARRSRAARRTDKHRAGREPRRRRGVDARELGVGAKAAQERSTASSTRHTAAIAPWAARPRGWRRRGRRAERLQCGGAAAVTIRPRPRPAPRASPAGAWLGCDRPTGSCRRALRVVVSVVGLRAGLRRVWLVAVSGSACWRSGPCGRGRRSPRRARALREPDGAGDDSSG